MSKSGAGDKPSSGSGSVLHEGRHFRVQLIPGTHSVLLVRSAHAFTSPQDVYAGCTPVQVVLDRLGRAKHNLLIDTRDAPANNDPVYESWFAPQRRRMAQGFRRVALIIHTAVGGLQTRRLIQTDGTDAAICTSFDEALAYLEGDASLPPGSGGPSSGSRSGASIPPSSGAAGGSRGRASVPPSSGERGVKK